MENLRQQIAEMRQSFFDEGILDKQFYQLELLEKRGNPNFVEEVLTIYFRESTTLLQTIEQAMETEPIEPVKVDRMLYKLKGSSAKAKAAFQELRNEHGNLRAKLELYFQQLRQACPAETALRPVPAEVILHDARPGDHRSRSC
ncbi:hypothetical protein V6N12_063387 [Hibiscus sabdariffa]|uniref:Histidine-containing phosphotransfer protein n=1 Tax=Hibiscus sabdariffa TaxID=183260 RepID=A0ABR2FBM8_9ROSI